MWVDPSSLWLALSFYRGTYIRLPSVFTVCGVFIIDARTWYTHIDSTRAMVRGDQRSSRLDSNYRLQSASFNLSLRAFVPR